ncbi:B12-binding domain-containing radical SAM protein [Candidatus Omnitrophota bacterium]
MKIVLVDPGFGEASFNTFGDSHWSSVIHHGLCSISAYAKGKGFSDIELIDLRRLKDWDNFREEVRKKDPRVMGISMRSCDFNAVMKAVGIIKDLNDEIITVVGGVHPTVAPEEVIPNEKIDHIITGEGEISFADLLKRISRRERSDRVIQGVRPNLDELPFDDRELYDYSTTLRLVSYPGVFRAPMVTMIGSHGCPFNCTFCAPHAKTMFGSKVRFRSPENVIEEMKALRARYAFRSIKFYDYSFGLDAAWVDRFCNLLDANRFKIDILAQSRANLICKNEGLIKRMKSSGLKLMLVGFESGSQKVLDSLKKGTTVEQNIKAAQILKKHKVLVGGSFMLGSPHETREDVDASVRTAKIIRANFISVAYFNPCPGSELYEYCKRNGLSLTESYDELVTYAPLKPRIKGIDYEYLNKATEEIMGDRFGGKVSGKIIKFIYLKTKGMLKLRHFLVYLYSKVVSSRAYRLLQDIKSR